MEESTARADEERALIRLRSVLDAQTRGKWKQKPEARPNIIQCKAKSRDSPSHLTGVRSNVRGRDSSADQDPTGRCGAERERLIQACQVLQELSELRQVNMRYA